MKSKFFDNIDGNWEDLISDAYNKDIVTLEPDSDGSLNLNQNYEKLKNVKHLVIAEGTEYIFESDVSHQNNEYFKNIETIIFPTTLKIINSFTFTDLANLHTITFKGEINEIKGYAFNNCKNLKNIKFNGKIKHIKKFAFNDCDITGELILPDDLVSIDEYAFNNNKNITKVVFPEGLQEIKRCSFRGCENLTGELVIPKSVNNIGGYSFIGCNLHKIIVNKYKVYNWEYAWDYLGLIYKAKIIYY